MKSCAGLLSSAHRQFSIIIEPLFESYNGMVSTASVEDLCRSTLSWLDQHCSLPALRPSESSITSSLNYPQFHSIAITPCVSSCAFTPFLCPFSGSEITSFPEHHHSHPDRPQPTARAGCACCHSG